MTVSTVLAFGHSKTIRGKFFPFQKKYLAFFWGIPGAAASLPAIKPEALSSFDGFRPKLCNKKFLFQLMIGKKEVYGKILAY